MTTKSEDENRVQINVTLRESTLQRLRNAFPDALDDSERVRYAVSESIELNGASEYTIRRSLETAAEG